MDDSTTTSHRATRARRSRGSMAVALAVPIGVLASGALVWQASYAAFTDTATNPGNSWSTGSVVISEDGDGIAHFDVTGMKANSMSFDCVTVTYEGTITPATVTFSVAGVDASDPLAEYLTLSAQEMTGTCGDTTGNVGGPAEVPLANGQVGATWQALTPGETRAYQFIVTVADDNDAQGKTATADLVWSVTS